MRYLGHFYWLLYNMPRFQCVLNEPHDKSSNAVTHVHWQFCQVVCYASGDKVD